MNFRNVLFIFYFSLIPFLTYSQIIEKNVNTIQSTTNIDSEYSIDSTDISEIMNYISSSFKNPVLSNNIYVWEKEISNEKYKIILKKNNIRIVYYSTSQESIYKNKVLNLLNYLSEL